MRLLEIEQETTEPKFGRLKTVERLFGLKRGTCYNSLRAGKIRGCSICVTSKRSRTRVIDLDSVNRILRSRLEALLAAHEEPDGALGESTPRSAKSNTTISLDTAALLAEVEPARRFGEYELLHEIARGGMGVVYKARQLSLNRIVAVKMILNARFNNPEFVQRFRAEAEAAANLRHPNIVGIYEIGEEEGQHYFSMEYVEGRDLDVATGNKVSSFPTSAAKSAQAFDYMITLCPDGSKLAVSSESERGVDIWDIKSGTRVYSLPEEDGTVYWLAWSADSRRLAVSRDNGKIAIWDLEIVSQILAKLGLNP